MLTTAKSAIYSGAIAFGTIVASFYTLPSNAQSTTAESFNFEKITVGNENNWNFSSEDETVSIRNNLKQLEEYNISGVENFDVRLIQANRRRLRNPPWGNRGYRPYYSLEDRIFPYFPVESRIYNYY